MSQDLKLLSFLLAHEMYHEGAHDDVEDMTGLVGVSFVVPDDRNRR